MILKKLPFFSTLLVLLLVGYKCFSQCNEVQTVAFCDIRNIPNGIVNLYDEYNNLGTGRTISPADGEWDDPLLTFAINKNNGDLYTWDLHNSTLENQSYNFNLIDPNSSCGEDPIITLQVVIGAFAGELLPPTGIGNANLSICETQLSSFDLFQVFKSSPSPHKNGTFEYLGASGRGRGRLIELDESTGKFEAEIFYTPGTDGLIDFEIFEFRYTVPADPTHCAPEESIEFKVGVVRDVQSGFYPSIQLGGTTFVYDTEEYCEFDIIDLDYQDAELNLKYFLQEEDIEGYWTIDNLHPSDPDYYVPDGIVNAKELYERLIERNPGFWKYTYQISYNVEARSALTGCDNKSTPFYVIFYKSPRPFDGRKLLFCVDDNPYEKIDLYDLIEFEVENDIIFMNPNNEVTEWTVRTTNSSNSENPFGFEPKYLDEEKTELNPNYSYKAPIDLSNVTKDDIGTYAFYLTFAHPENEDTFYPIECDPKTSPVIIQIGDKHYSGEDTNDLQLCKLDYPEEIDLMSLLKTNGSEIYKDDDAYWLNLDTGEKVESPLILKNFPNQENFDLLFVNDNFLGYEIPEFKINPTTCPNETELSFTLNDTESPIAEDNSNYIFCQSEFPTVADLSVNSMNDVLWYDSLTSTTPLDSSVYLESKTYYSAAINENCESLRTAIDVTINAPGKGDCDSFIGDGISPNGDGNNDYEDLRAIASKYPNFELKILNRYGTVVFKADKHVLEFEGKSNVPLTFGNILPNGVYFYILEFNDNKKTDPETGDYYINR